MLTHYLCFSLNMVLVSLCNLICSLCKIEIFNLFKKKQKLKLEKGNKPTYLGALDIIFTTY